MAPDLILYMNPYMRLLGNEQGHLRIESSAASYGLSLKEAENLAHALRAWVQDQVLTSLEKQK